MRQGNEGASPFELYLDRMQSRALADGVGKKFPGRHTGFGELAHFLPGHLALGLHLPDRQGHAVDSFLPHAEHRGSIANGRHHRNDVLYGKAIRQQFL